MYNVKAFVHIYLEVGKTHETVGIVAVERDLHTAGAANEFHIAKFFCLLLCPLNVQGVSNMTGTDLCVNKPHCAAAVRP